MVDLSKVMLSERDRLSNYLRAVTPGVIQSFDPTMLTCVVQITAREHHHDKNNVYPLLVDVPLVFPAGGGCTLTFPIKKGDECVVLFSDRCIDFWWQSGDIQALIDRRKHELCDAFAIVGIKSQRRVITNVSTHSTQLRTDNGATFIEIAEDNQINMLTSGNLTAKATGEVAITAPSITLTGNVVINGNLSQGMGETGGEAIMAGPITVTGDITAAGISLQHHKHGNGHNGANTTEAK